MRKLSADEYVDIRTGQVLEYNHTQNRSQSLYEVSQSLKHGRDMINANVLEPSFCRWLTLTYRENMQDPQKLAFDFKNFNKRCRAKFGHYEYITAAEPQARGAWHLHVILIFDHVAPFMSNDDVSICWKQGFVNVQSLNEAENVGAYLTAYLGDVALDELTPEEQTKVRPDSLKDVELHYNDGTVENKRYVKGGRMHFYPVGMNIFRYSKGCRKPLKSVMEYSEARKKVSSAKLTYQSHVFVVDSESKFQSEIRHEYYINPRD